MDSCRPKRCTSVKGLILICLIGFITLWAQKSLFCDELVTLKEATDTTRKVSTDIGPATLDNVLTEYTIVTAASSNHFCALEAMLYAFQEVRLDVPAREFPRLVIYNLGISAEQSEVLENLERHSFFDELVQFNYTAYPAFWNVRVKRGQYAWKAGAIKEVQEKYGGVVIWLDTGDVPNIQFLRTIPLYIQRHGFWSPRSTGHITEKFNHPGLFRYFNANIQDYATFENCNGAALGFNMDDDQVLERVFLPWYECALDRECIAPQGSSRRNHRQDQSAISFLTARSGYRCFEYPEFHGLVIHQDQHCRQRLALLEQAGQLLHPSSAGH